MDHLSKGEKRKQLKDKILLTFFEDVYNWSHDAHLDIETKMENIYHSMGLLLDEFFKLLLASVEEDLMQGDIGRLMKNLLISLPAFFISVPFFSSLKHLSMTEYYSPNCTGATMDKEIFKNTMPFGSPIPLMILTAFPSPWSVSAGKSEKKRAEPHLLSPVWTRMMRQGKIFRPTSWSSPPSTPLPPTFTTVTP